ncbi:MAG TPA: RNA 2',3'-cyclic phosphodiesterase [Kineobactrum sp.]
MRVFFGIELDQETALAIDAWRERQFGEPGRAVPVANFHITLAFIGDIPEAALGTPCEAVDERLARRPLTGSQLLLNQTGYWPKAMIYWLGAETWPTALGALSSSLRSSTGRLNKKRDRTVFVPHVTLFRRCPEAPPAPLQPPSFALAYQRFSLFESRERREGVSYHPLQDWVLAAAPA